MQRLVLFGIALVFLVMGCSYKQVVAEYKCTKIVGEKSYQVKLLGIIPGPLWRYKVLADRREIWIVHVKFDSGDHCETVYHEQPDLNLDKQGPR